MSDEFDFIEPEDEFETIEPIETIDESLEAVVTEPGEVVEGAVDLEAAEAMEEDMSEMMETDQSLDEASTLPIPLPEPDLDQLSEEEGIYPLPPPDEIDINPVPLPEPDTLPMTETEEGIYPVPPPELVEMKFGEMESPEEAGDEFGATPLPIPDEIDPLADEGAQMDVAELGEQELMDVTEEGTMPSPPPDEIDVMTEGAVLGEQADINLDVIEEAGNGDTEEDDEELQT